MLCCYARKQIHKDLLNQTICSLNTEQIGACNFTRIVLNTFQMFSFFSVS